VCGIVSRLFCAQASHGFSAIPGAERTSYRPKMLMCALAYLPRTHTNSLTQNAMRTHIYPRDAYCRWRRRASASLWWCSRRCCAPWASSARATKTGPATRTGLGPSTLHLQLQNLLPPSMALSVRPTHRRRQHRRMPKAELSPHQLRRRLRPAEAVLIRGDRFETAYMVLWRLEFEKPEKMSRALCRRV
jgi:hypothetical protein